MLGDFDGFSFFLEWGKGYNLNLSKEISRSGVSNGFSLGLD